MERKDLRQLIASAQQELNRLTTKEKALTRKEKTHQKIVLGGEVAKYLGLDIDHDILVGFLLTFVSSTEVQRNTWLSNGARSRQNEILRKDKKNKISTRKANTNNASADAPEEKDISENADSGENTTATGGIQLNYNHFSRRLAEGLNRKKTHND